MRGSGTSETECPTSERICVSYLRGDTLDHARDCPRCRDVEQDVRAIDGWLLAHASSVFDVPLPAVGSADHGA